MGVKMSNNYLLVLTFSTLLISGFVSQASSQIIITNLDNAVVQLNISPSHVESGKAVHHSGYVNLINTNGFLVKPPHDVAIQLKSDNPSIASVPSEIIINGYQNYGVFNIETGSMTGKTTISATFNGQTVFQNFIVGKNNFELPEDVELVVHLPSKEMHVNSKMPFSVYLQSSEGNVVQAPYDIKVMFDYEDTLIGLDNNSLEIKEGAYYGWGLIQTNENIGNAFIRASQDELNLQNAQNIKVSSSFPAGIEIDIFPKIVPREDARYIDVIVSLIDSDGSPTIARENTQLKFFSDSDEIDKKIDETMNDALYNGVIRKGDFSYHFKQKLKFSHLKPEINIGVSTEGLGVDTDCFVTRPPVTFVNSIAGNKTTHVFTLESFPSNSKTIASYQIGAVLQIPEEDSDLYEELRFGEINGKNSDCIDFELFDAPINIITEGAGDLEYRPILSNENLVSKGEFGKINLVSSDGLLLNIEDAGKITAGYAYGTAEISSSKETGPVLLSSTITGIGSADSETSIINTLKHEKTIIFSPTGQDTILFDKNGNFDLFLVSLDTKGRPTFVEDNIRFLLSPVNEIIEISTDQTFAHANFHSDSFGTDSEDAIVLDAIPIGISADQSLTTKTSFQREPSSSVKVILPYDELDVSSNQPYSGIVQLIDVRGNPLKASSDVTVKIETLNSNLVEVPRFVDIQDGTSYTEFPIQVNGKQGKLNLSVNANGVVGSSGGLEIKSFLNKLSINTGAIEEPIPPGESLEVNIYVDSEKLEPIKGAELRIEGNNASITPVNIKTQDDGSAKIHLTAGNEPTVSFQVFATAEGYVEEQRNFEFTVDAAQIQPEETLVLGLPEWVLYVGLAAIGVIVAAIVVFLKKPKQSLEDEEDEIFEEDI